MRNKGGQGNQPESIGACGARAYCRHVIANVMHERMKNDYKKEN